MSSRESQSPELSEADDASEKQSVDEPEVSGFGDLAANTWNTNDPRVRAPHPPYVEKYRHYQPPPSAPSEQKKKLKSKSKSKAPSSSEVAGSKTGETVESAPGLSTMNQPGALERMKKGSAKLPAGAFEREQQNPVPGTAGFNQDGEKMTTFPGLSNIQTIGESKSKSKSYETEQQDPVTGVAGLNQAGERMTKKPGLSNLPKISGSTGRSKSYETEQPDPESGVSGVNQAGEEMIAFPALSNLPKLGDSKNKSKSSK